VAFTARTNAWPRYEAHRAEPFYGSAPYRRRRKLLIINDLVEATGVELYNPLILRKLLVLQEPRSARNASQPGRRYKNGTNIFVRLCPASSSSALDAHTTRYRILKQVEQRITNSATIFPIRTTVTLTVLTL
jgi:hypothetical protein